MVTETGYRKRTYEEILNAKNEKSKELFGEDINTEGNTVLGKINRINAYDQCNVEEIAEKIYYSIFPQTSSGQSLDRLAWSVGIKRNPAIPSRYRVYVTGTPETVIEYGFLVGTESGLTFYNTKETTIDFDETGENGECEIIVECTEAGTIGNISASDIIKIINPATHIDEISGLEVVQMGVDEESDYDFRKRFETVREGKGSCTEASLISAILSVPTVKDVYLKVETGKVTCYVDGGESYHNEIAEAIFNKKPVGVSTDGDISIFVSYGALKNYEIKFSHSVNASVYVNLELITNTKFKTNGYEEIKSNIAEFINNLGLGEPVISTALYSQIYCVEGVVSAVVTISKDGAAYSMENIEVEPNESCSLVSLKINNNEYM